MSAKSMIKSKKEKLNEKKFSKGNTPHLVDLVQSSEQSLNHNQNIQKRSKHSGKYFNVTNTIKNQQYTPTANKLDLTKMLSKVSQQKKQLQELQKIVYKGLNSNDETGSIEVVETLQRTNTDKVSAGRSLFSYKLVGKQETKFISQSHLKGQLNSHIQHLQQKQRHKQKKQCEELSKIMEGHIPSDDSINLSKEKVQKQQQKAQKKQKRIQRYFEEELSDNDGFQEQQKCFRCFKKGHIAKYCMEEQVKQLCSFCQMEHHQSVCQSSPCFKCCQPGHIAQDCKSTGIVCLKCKKRGHRSDNCQVFIGLDYHARQPSYIKSRFKLSDIKKLKCLDPKCKDPTGHFNCYEYNKNKCLGPYESESKQKFNQNYQNNERNNQKYDRYNERNQRFSDRYRR